ncbi:hypothetical protein KC350_g7629 [Hortaea werneckii]|nr:hypothetical protein KC350_g7629 [Hortaea werneckii]
MRLLVALAASTAGVQGILQRRLPNHVDDSTFSLVNTSITTTSSSSSSSNNNNTTFLSKPQDQYTVLNGPNPGQIHISGTSPNRPRHQSPLVPHHLLPRGPLVVVVPRLPTASITRQVMANGFYPLYTTFITASNTSQPSTYNITTARHTGKDLLRLLGDIDTILTASGIAHFSLPAWIASARAWADPTPLFSTTRPSMNHSPPSINTTAVTDRANFYEYNARNQITLWGPRGEISDYASKQWGGLIGSYYLPRWEMFVNSTLNGNEGSSMPFASSSAGDEGLVKELEDFELEWQGRRWGGRLGEGFEVVGRDALQREMGRVVEGWAGVFGV